MRNILHLLILVLTISFQTVISQSKPEKYYNVNFQLISKDEFEKSVKKETVFSYTQYNLEDQTAKILYKRKTTGKLNEQELSLLKKELSKIGPLENEITILIFYPGKDECNNRSDSLSIDFFRTEYKNKLDRITKYNHFWIYKTDEDLKYYHPEKINWKKDNDRVIEKLLFKMHYPCFSSAVIDSNGNYRLNLAEFATDQIIEDVKAMKKNIVKKSNNWFYKSNKAYRVTLKKMKYYISFFAESVI